MNPNEFGKKLGIGVRIAGRIAQQRVQANAAAQASAVPNSGPHPASSPQPTYTAPGASAAPRIPAPAAAQVKNLGKQSHNYTRAAGRGIGGFLRPFGKVGGLLWLEVTGFFFGLFAIFFAQNIWRARLDYASGPQHQRFLMGVGLTLVFGYLSVSAFWRARRR